MEFDVSCTKNLQQTNQNYEFYSKEPTYIVVMVRSFDNFKNSRENFMKKNHVDFLPQKNQLKFLP